MYEAIAAAITLAVGVHLGRLWERRSQLRKRALQIERAYARHEHQMRILRDQLKEWR